MPLEQIALTLSPELAVIIVAALPVLELRGAVPLGLTLGLHPASTYILAVVGNMLPMPVIVTLLHPFMFRLRRSPRVSEIIESYYRRTRAKSTHIKRYGFWGLVLFVALPLPSTGAWTGAIAACLLGLRFWPTMLALLLGTLLAGVIVTSVCLLGTATLLF